MPLSVALPSPAIEFFSRYDFPVLQGSSGDGAGVAFSNDWIKGRPTRYATAPDTLAELVGAGGTGVTETIRMDPGGRPHVRVITTTTTQGSYLPINDWLPAFDAAGQAAGALLPPPAVVGVVDIHLATTAAAYPGANADTIGLFFFPSAGNLDPWGPPGVWAASPAAGGFGIFVNDDGGGASQYEFISFDAVPNVLQRTTVPVPDVTLWSSFRFVIRTALPGAAANLTLQANGSTVAGVNGIPFDDVTLFRPDTLNANATGWAIAQTAGAMGGAGIRFAISAKFGRFTPDGQELQGI